MKVVALNGSAKPGGNTSVLIEKAFEPMRQAGIECELISLGKKDIAGCTGCRVCASKRDGKCYGRHDDGNDILGTALDADGIILASPVYFGDVTAELKAMIDRLGMVGRTSGKLTRKPGAGIVAVRRAGAMHALDTINHFFGIEEMYLVSSSYWNIGIGLDPGDVEGDEEGIETMQRLGENFAYLLNKLA